MAFFDSPFERCAICDAYVVLDQTQQECADEHHCQTERCPLSSFFARGVARRLPPRDEPKPPRRLPG